MFRHSEAEAQGIREYVEWQSRRDNEKVLHAEKVASERVMGWEYEVWVYIRMAAKAGGGS